QASDSRQWSSGRASGAGTSHEAKRTERGTPRPRETIQPEHADEASALHFAKDSVTSATHFGAGFAQSRSCPAQTLRALPVSRKDFMLESTRGQPRETLPAMTEPGLKSPCITLRRTMSSIGSISKVTRELSAVSAGSAQVSTK